MVQCKLKGRVSLFELDTDVLKHELGNLSFETLVSEVYVEEIGLVFVVWESVLTK